MDTKDKNRIIERQKHAFQGIQYSIQRIDLLIIALCGGGIYVCMETLKYLKQSELPIHCTIHIAGLAFLLGIITNMVGQWYGKRANQHDYCWCESRLDNDPEDIINKYDIQADQASNLSSKWDLVSMVITAIGLISIVSFFWFIF